MKRFLIFVGLGPLVAGLLITVVFWLQFGLPWLWDRALPLQIGFSYILFAPPLLAACLCDHLARRQPFYLRMIGTSLLALLAGGVFIPWVLGADDVYRGPFDLKWARSVIEPALYAVAAAALCSAVAYLAVYRAHLARISRHRSLS